MARHLDEGMKSQVRKLASNGIALAVGGIVAQLAFTFLEVLVARQLGAESFGVFVTAYALTILVALFVEFGTPMWAIQEGSRDHGRIPITLGSSLTITLTLFAIIYLAVLAGSRVWPSNPVLHFLPIILPYGLVLSVQNCLASVYSSYQTMRVTAIFQGIAPLAVLAIYLAYTSQHPDLPSVGIAYVIGSVLITGIWFLYTMRIARPVINFPDIRAAVKNSYQYGLTGVLGQMFFKTDILMVSILAGLKEAGIYAAAFKLVDLYYKIPILSSRVFAPAIFKSSKGPGKSFLVLSGLMARVLTVAGLVAGIVSFELAEDIIRILFGEEYAASAPILRILGGVMVTNSMIVVLQLLMSGIDLHSQRVSFQASAIVFQIVLNALLIPQYGAIGAAIATLLSGAALVVAYAWVSAKSANFKFGQWLLLPSCVALVAAIASAMLDVHALMSALIAVTGFGVALLFTGFVKKDELAFVVNSMTGKGSDSGAD